MSAFKSKEAEEIFLKKIKKNFENQPIFFSSFLKEVLQIEHDGILTKALAIDKERFDRTIRKGLYYRKFNIQWRCSLNVVTSDLYDPMAS